MIRTSIVLPPALHQQLSALARQEGKKLSEFVREQLGRFVVEQRESQLDQMYAGIRQMKGLAKDDVTDASQTIDEVLYGENGSWRGEPSHIGLWELPQDKNGNKH
jgi:hypothetical protein